jgi:hypothetical protein
LAFNILGMPNASLGGMNDQSFMETQAPAFSGDKKPRLMRKTTDLFTEVVRNARFPLRNVEDRPLKPLKHRYERRKVREYLRIGDWVTAE